MWLTQLATAPAQTQTTLTKSGRTRMACITLRWPLVKWTINVPRFTVSLRFISTRIVNFCVRCQITSFHREVCELEEGKELPKLIPDFRYLKNRQGSGVPSLQPDSLMGDENMTTVRNAVSTAVNPWLFLQCLSATPELSFSPLENSHKRHPVTFKCLQVPGIKVYREKDIVLALKIPKFIYQALLLTNFCDLG